MHNIVRPIEAQTLLGGHDKTCYNRFFRSVFDIDVVAPLLFANEAVVMSIVDLQVAVAYAVWTTCRNSPRTFKDNFSSLRRANASFLWSRGPSADVMLTIIISRLNCSQKRSLKRRYAPKPLFTVAVPGTRSEALTMSFPKL